MKKLPALALIAFGWAALNPALAQQGLSMDDKYPVLELAATMSRDSKLQKLLHHFKAIKVWESEPHPRNHDGEHEIWVPGDVKGIDWQADQAQQVQLVDGNFTAILTIRDLQELKKRKDALIVAGVRETPTPTQGETKAEPREEAASPEASPTPDVRKSEPVADAPPSTPKQQPSAPPAPVRTKNPEPSEEKSTPPPADDDWSALGGLLILAVVAFVIVIIVRSRNKRAEPGKMGGRSHDGYEEAISGIPHANCGWTKNGGFEVRLKTNDRATTGFLEPSAVTRITTS